MSTCIIPSQLLNSAPDIAVLDLGCKKSLETACEPSDIVSLRGSLKPISSVKWKRDSWMRHLFGRICAPSHTTSFEDWWISQLQESLANRTAPQANAPVDPTTDSCSTNGLQGLNGCDPDLFSSRMSKVCCTPKCQTVNSASPGQSRDWKAWVTQLRQEYSVRLKSAHLTQEKEYSCWPTASARDWKDTPGMAQSATNKDGSHRNRTDQLARAVYSHGQADRANPSTNGNRQEPWATPTARDYKSGRGKESRVYKELTPMVERVQVGRLNPRWVETLLGLSIGWTMPSCSHPIADPANVVTMLSAGGAKNTTQTAHVLGQIAVTTDNRTDELRLLGNGVVPATAEKAIRTLLQKHFSK